MHSPIDINYGGKLFKSRFRSMIRDFLYRFYTPFSFLVWTLVAFDVNTCANTPALVVTISIIAAATNSYYTYMTWRSNVLLITAAQTPKIPMDTKITIATSDFIVQLLCTLLSFWWIDDLHECIPLQRKYMGITWLIMLLLSMVLHIVQYYVKNKKIISVTADAYKHVQSSSA